MNPKTPQDLDPKLKEAYDRVMGGSFNPPAASPSPSPKMENPAPGQNPFANPTAPVPPVTVLSPSTSPSGGQQVISAKKKSKISPIIFLAVGISFFTVYAVVWAKIFNLF